MTLMILLMLAEEREWVYECRVTRKKVRGGVGAGVVGHPLNEWDKLDDYLLYDFPSASSTERFNKALPVIKKTKVRASQINEEMKFAAAHEIASIIPEDELSEENIIPNVFNPQVVERETEAVAQAAIESGVARI